MRLLAASPVTALSKKSNNRWKEEFTKCKNLTEHCFSFEIVCYKLLRADGSSGEFSLPTKNVWMTNWGKLNQ
ncbi:hypothetical protein ACROYT_G044166 [Oculina patagonica]